MGSWLGSIISSIIGGAIIGALARFILPGRQNISVPTTIVAGMVAAFIGTLIARIFGFHDTKGIDWWERIIQVVLAIVAVSYAARRFPRKTAPATSTGTYGSGTTYGGSGTGTGTYGSGNGTTGGGTTGGTGGGTTGGTGTYGDNGPTTP